MKRQGILIVLILILFVVSQPSGNAAQKNSRSAVVSRKAPPPELASVAQFKEAFDNDEGKVRVVALISPT